MSVLVLEPNSAEFVYSKAAEVFCDLYFKVTGENINKSKSDDGLSDLVVIGSDSVNDFLMEEVLNLNIKNLNIRYGTDDYSIFTYKKGKRNVLVLAGGRGRSTLYAVYDYFEKFLGCHYFWDGDIIPKNEKIVMENINLVQSPRFLYRGLRYFAHRGLKRFQAEHWSFDDWKQELDWLVKKRLNFFMLRTGMDDVWQRAFPDDVPYPENFKTITGIDADGYNDRSDFWSLRYKGELRAKILEYARELDLLYPTDCGTMTHWYSRTPIEFLQSRKPDFLAQANEQYTASDTGKVFDFTKKENMDYYVRLTETMVDNYDKNTSLFHTIGLGERMIYKDRDKNLALKLVAYRRIAERMKENYPESKLMVATWDFIGYWTNEEISHLISQLDPEHTIILDYTSDMNDEEHSFINWNMVHKFPYVFGLFHAYESESELRGPYDRIDKRLKIASDDPYCKGMILWPELSHSDPLVLEYLSQNSWAPLERSIEEITESFCHNRYGKYSKVMNRSWQSILPFIKLGEWGGECQSRPVKKDITLCPRWHVHMDLWPRLCFFMNHEDSKAEDLYEYFLFKELESKKLSENIIKALNLLVENPEGLENPFVLRDSIDIVRTVLSRFLNFTIINALVSIEDKERIKALKNQYMMLLDIISEVLKLNDDFSIYHSLKELEKAAPVNPDFETALKRNITNAYSSQHASELVDYIFKAEGEVVFDKLLTAENVNGLNFEDEYYKIFENFMNTPLESMQCNKKLDAVEVINKAISYVKEII